MIQTRGVVHFSIPVSDTSRSTKFYCGLLGMKLLHETPQMAFLDSGGDCVVLVRVEKPISTARLREVHHSFLVDGDTYRGAIADLKSNGVNVLYEENRQDGVIDGPRTYFHDPDGNTLEIIDLTHYAGAKPAA